MKIFIMIIALLFGAQLISQCDSTDEDMDGISDVLEQRLAEKFAPVWRFHGRAQGGNNNNNLTATYYPVSIDDWAELIYEEQGEYPVVKYNINGETVADFLTPDGEVEISNFLNLDSQILAEHQLGSDFWKNYVGPNCEEQLNAEQLYISNYPKRMFGQPDDFDTYFKCHIYEGVLNVGYFIYRPYDTKGVWTIFNIEAVKHRADWLGINVSLSSLSDYSCDDAEIEDVAITKVAFNGHSSSHVTPETGDLILREGSHPEAYISWGSAALYPGPGEVHNFNVLGWANTATDIAAALSGSFVGAAINAMIDTADKYDDYYNGKGLSVETWRGNRNLVNIGSKGEPLNGQNWLNFPGSWGPDFSFNDSKSPRGIGFNCIRNPGSTNDMTWDKRKLDEGDEWSGEFIEHEHDNIAWDTEREAGAVIYGAINTTDYGIPRWRLVPVLVSGPMEFPTLNGPNIFNQNYKLINHISSVFLVGDAVLKLYTEPNFGGTEVIVTSSSPWPIDGPAPDTYFDWALNVEARIFWNSMKIETVSNEYTNDILVDNESTADYLGRFPNINETTGSIIEGMEATPEYGNLGVRAGVYEENITLDKPMTIRCYFGEVICGSN